MRTTIAAVFIFSASFVTGAADAQVAPPTTGTTALPTSFTVSGEGANGVKYTGTASLKLIGGSMYTAKWTLGSRILSGVCFRDATILSCAWSSNGKATLLSYLVKSTTLDGVFFRPSDTKLGKEVLTGPTPTLKGKYKITLGKNPDGSTYEGVAAILPVGDNVYKFGWTIGAQTVTGIGVRSNDGTNDVVAAAANDGGTGDYGALTYKISADGKQLTGVWAQSVAGANSRGTETMKGI
jgi:hypothetical protein